MALAGTIGINGDRLDSRGGAAIAEEAELCIEARRFAEFLLIEIRNEVDPAGGAGPSCCMPVSERGPGREPGRDIGARAARACDPLPGRDVRVSALGEGRLRAEARELVLTRITPQIARRWFTEAREAAQQANASEEDLHELIKGDVPTIRTREDLAEIADQAFSCAAEIDIPDPSGR